MAVEPWPKVGAPRVIASARDRSLVRQEFLVHGQVEEFVLHVTSQSSVLVFPVTTDLRVIAIELFRPGANRVLIELPGGNVESEAENLDKARVVTRELLEETGYRPGHLIPLCHEEVWFDPSVFVTKFYPFLALDCVKTQDAAEHEVITVDLETWFEMCSTGRVVDSKTLSTTLLAQPHLSRVTRP